MSASSFPSATSSVAPHYDFIGGVRRRILASIASTVGWLSFVLLYLAFWGSRFSLFQDIVVVIVSLVVLAGFLLSLWIAFGLRWGGHWDI